MRFFKLGVTFVFFMSFLFVSATFAADVAKIGLIDYQIILATSEAGKAIQTKLAKKGTEMQADLQAKKTAIEEQTADYKKQAPIMSREAQEEKEKDLTLKAMDLDNAKKKYEAEFKTLEREEINQFQKDLFDIVEEIGKKEGYLLILDRGSSGTVYAPSTIDITDRVIQQVNEAFAKKQNG